MINKHEQDICRILILQIFQFNHLDHELKTKSDKTKTLLTCNGLFKILCRHNVRYKRQNLEVTGETKYQVFKADLTENQIGTLLLASFDLALNLTALVLLILLCFFNFFPLSTSHFSIQVINSDFKPLISSMAIVCITCASFKSVCREEINWA